jgi:hypothetical protein
MHANKITLKERKKESPRNFYSPANILTIIYPVEPQNLITVKILSAGKKKEKGRNKRTYKQAMPQSTTKMSCSLIQPRLRQPMKLVRLWS